MKISYKNISGSYEIEGQGPVVVWLHGFMENIKIWKHQRSFFNAHFTNVYINLLGHGTTEVLNETHTMEAQAKWVKFVLDSLEINTYSMIGHSMGGYVALAFLDQFPEYISNIVLLNSTSLDDSPEKKINRERAIQIIDQQKDAFLRMGVINLFDNTQRKTLSKEIDVLLEELSSISSAGIIAALKGMKQRPSRLDTLKHFQGKKLMVIGKKDPVLAAKDSVLEAHEVNASILELKTGHMSYMEAPKRLNNFLLDFLLE